MCQHDKVHYRTASMRPMTWAWACLSISQLYHTICWHDFPPKRYYAIKLIETCHDVICKILDNILGTFCWRNRLFWQLRPMSMILWKMSVHLSHSQPLDRGIVTVGTPFPSSLTKWQTLAWRLTPHRGESPSGRWLTLIANSEITDYLSRMVETVDNKYRHSIPPR